MLVSVRDAIAFLQGKGIVMKEELFEGTDLNATFKVKSLSCIERGIQVWEPWMVSSDPEEKGKLASRIICSLLAINCSALNCIRGSKSYIGNTVDIKKETPDITTVIGASSAFYVDERGRKDVL